VIDASVIPTELRALPRWVRWKSVPAEPKPRKVPIRATDPGCASSIDPATWGAFDEALANVGRHGTCGIGFVFAKEDGFVGIDMDGCLTEEGKPNDKAARLLSQTRTYAEVSPSGNGLHLIGRGTLNGHRGINRKKEAGIEIYDTARFFTMTGKALPGSPTEIGECQAAIDAVVTKLEPSRATAPFPHPRRRTSNDQERLIERARAYVARMPGAISGQGGHEATFRAALALVKGFSLNTGTALDILRDYNTRCDPPWSEKELLHKIEDAGTAEVPDGYVLERDEPKRPRRHVSGLPLETVAAVAPVVNLHEHAVRRRMQAPAADGFELTDTGNSERFAARFGERTRYVPEFNESLVFDNGRWIRDVGSVRTLEATRAITREMRSSSDMGLAGYGVKSEKRAARENMLALSRSLPGMAISPAALDADPWLLGCPNGVLDLRTGQLRESRPEDYITKRTGVPFSAAAKAPRWRRFICEVTCADVELEAFLQRTVGYSLTGRTGEQVFFFLYGDGANGKGTFIKVLQRALGDYAAVLSTAALMASYGQAHPTELVPLFGARFVTANEVSDGRSWNEARLKELTGEDRITARGMRENFWSFEPTHKLWISGNYRPRVHGDDFGLWRRVRLIPFEARFEVNSHLLEELLAELPGVLAWAVEGCLAWQRDGLGVPARVREATDTYRERENLVGQFVEEACHRHPQAETSTADLYAVFERWCAKAGERTPAKRGFSERLERLGFKRNESRNARGFIGIGLRPEWASGGPT
jgi:putative DNA primase/helicase